MSATTIPEPHFRQPLAKQMLKVSTPIRSAARCWASL